MPKTCPTTPYSVKQSPYSDRQSPFSKLESPYEDKYFCPFGKLLLDDGVYMLLDNSGLIILE